MIDAVQPTRAGQFYRVKISSPAAMPEHGAQKWVGGSTKD
jgi:hypothetical protein